MQRLSSHLPTSSIRDERQRAFRLIGQSIHRSSLPSYANPSARLLTGCLPHLPHHFAINSLNVLNLTRGSESTCQELKSQISQPLLQHWQQPLPDDTISCDSSPPRSTTATPGPNLFSSSFARCLDSTCSTRFALLCFAAFCLACFLSVLSYRKVGSLIANKIKECRNTYQERSHSTHCDKQFTDIWERPFLKYSISRWTI